MSGVYSTVHLDSGDIDTDEVTEVRIDGGDVWISMVRRDIPRGGTFDEATLHVGGRFVRLGLPATKVRRGDDVTVVQRIELTVLT